MLKIHSEFCCLQKGEFENKNESSLRTNFISFLLLVVIGFVPGQTCQRPLKKHIEKYLCLAIDIYRCKTQSANKRYCLVCNRTKFPIGCVSTHVHTYTVMNYYSLHGLKQRRKISYKSKQLKKKKQIIRVKRSTNIHTHTNISKTHTPTHMHSYIC